MYKHLNAPHNTTQEEQDAFRALFTGPSCTLSIINAEGKPQAITPDDRDDTIRSHLEGTPFNYRINSKGKPCGARLRGAGELLGASPIDDENLVGWLGFDLDGKGHKNGALEDVTSVTAAILAACYGLGLTAYFDVSKGGNGRHVWLFFPERILAADARALGLFLVPKDAPLFGGGVANPYKSKAVEIFPKQTEKNHGGNPLWLPGWCRAEHGRLQLTDASGAAVRFSEVKRCDLAALKAALDFATAVEDKRVDILNAEARQRLGVVQSLRVGGVALSPGEAHPEALRDIERACKTIAKAPNRAPCFGLFYTVAAWVNGGFCSEAAAREAILNACDSNGSAAKWPEHDRLRWWRGALSQAAPKIAPLSDFYLRQFEDAAKIEATKERKTLDEQRIEAQKLIQDHIEARRAGVGVVAADPSVGKTTAAILAAKNLSGSKKVILALPSHDDCRAVVADALAIGVKAKRVFSPASARGLLDAEGRRVCQKSETTLDNERALGRFGKEHCTQCAFKKDCKAALGYEGDPNASLVITTHASLRGANTKGYLVIDELKEAYEARRISFADMEALASGKGELVSSSAGLLRASAQALIAGVALDAARLAALAVEVKGKVHTNASPQHQCAKHHAGAWRAAHWLFSLSLSDRAPRFKQTQNGYEFVTPNAASIALRRGFGLVLNGCADERLRLDLANASGAIVKLEHFAIASGIAHHRVWMPTTQGARKNALPHKTPALEIIRPLVARVLKDIHEHTEISRVLIATHRDIFKLLQGDLGDELRSLLVARAGSLALVYWGGRGNEGTNEFKTFDAAYGIGDPLSGAEPHPDEFTRSEEWTRSRNKAAYKLKQFFARLRFDAAPYRARRMVHLGCVLPSDWTGANAQVEYIPPGRPKTAAEDLPGDLANWRVDLAALVARVGVRGAMRALEISTMTFYALTEGRSTPCLAVAENIKQLQGVDGVLLMLVKKEENKDQKSTLREHQKTQQEQQHTAPPPDQREPGLLAALRRRVPSLAMWQPPTTPERRAIIAAFFGAEATHYQAAAP